MRELYAGFESDDAGLLESYRPDQIDRLDLNALPFTGRIINDRKVTDHHAIIPAGKVPQNLPPAQQRVFDAVVTRLRPILVTSLTTLGGVMPTAYGLGGYDAVVSPMSLALGWGLAFSTLVTLLLVPTLYTLAGDLRELGGLGFRARLAVLLTRR